MVSEADRVLVEARAMGVDIEAATAHPIRTMLKIDLVASSFAIAVFLLFYYASVSVLTIYWVVVFNRTTARRGRHQRLVRRRAVAERSSSSASSPTSSGCESLSCW